MNKYEKFYCLLGLAWIVVVVIVIFIIQSQFNFLNSEIQSMHTQYQSQQTQPRVLNGVVITPQMAELLNCIALAESGGNQKAIGQNNERGIFQYKKATWAFFNEKYKLNLDINKPIDQVMMTVIALDDNKHQHWTTYEDFCK